MSCDRACKAHSGLVCVATWNCRRITSESSSVFLTACCRMTSRVFALLTPNLVSQSCQAASIVEPRTPIVKLYSKKTRTQIYVDLRYVDPQERVLKHYF